MDDELNPNELGLLEYARRLELDERQARDAADIEMILAGRLPMPGSRAGDWEQR